MWGGGPGCRPTWGSRFFFFFFCCCCGVRVRVCGLDFSRVLPSHTVHALVNQGNQGGQEAHHPFSPWARHASAPAPGRLRVQVAAEQGREGWQGSERANCCGARGRRGAGLQGGRARERERVRPAPPRAPPLPPPIQIPNPGSIAGHNDEAGGVWVGRKQCARPAGSGVAGRESAQARGSALPLPPPPLPPLHPNTKPWLDCRARPGGCWGVSRAETERAAGGERGCREGERASARGSARPSPPPPLPPSHPNTTPWLDCRARPGG